MCILLRFYKFDKNFGDSNPDPPEYGLTQIIRSYKNKREEKVLNNELRKCETFAIDETCEGLEDTAR